ncbi:MAG TPA: NB-ARC domain-containing protein [Pilimelia sp.]|nr:NB-ARC domain-containing protein [Pilimelia sp.]
MVVLHGPGGAGKSALAVRAAHGVSQLFPDGQLYVNLLGSTPGLRPLEPVEVLNRLLRSLGVPPGEVPGTRHERAAAFRTLTSGRRLLFLLDNVVDADQVGDLIPASAEGAVVLTARDPLPSVDADARLRIGALPASEAVSLLRAVADSEAPDGATAQRIVELCDGLPLALRLAAGRLAGGAGLPAEELVGRLMDRRRRLDELQLGGLGVRSCVRVAYDGLRASPDASRRLAAAAFRALGTLPVPDFSPGVVAAMLDVAEPPGAADAVYLLAASGLLEPAGSGRFRFHDLVRLVAVEEAEADGPVAAAALERALRFYSVGARRADLVLRPGRPMPFTAPVVAAPPGTPVLPDQAMAKAWIDAELPNAMAIADEAGRVAAGHLDVVRWLVYSLWLHMFVRFEWSAAQRIVERLAANAEAAGNEEIAAWAAMMLGRSMADAGDFARAAQLFHRAHCSYVALGDRQAEALVLCSLGILADYRGDAAESISLHRRSLALARRLGDTGQEALVLANLGHSLAVDARYAEAIEVLEQSLTLLTTTNDRLVRASANATLAAIMCVLGDVPVALERAEATITDCREGGDHIRECDALLTRSEIRLRTGRRRAAREDAEAAQRLADARGNPYARTLAAAQAAKVAAVLGEPDATTRLAAAAAQLAAIRGRRDRLIERVVLGAGPAAWPAPAGGVKGLGVGGGPRGGGVGGGGVGS